MAGLEWLLRRDEGIDVDLSENNLANMHGFAANYDDGGNNEMAMAVLLREEGPVMEALDPYPRPGGSVRERGVRIPRKVVFVPMRSSISDANQLQADLNAFKRAILEYGPLATSYGDYSQYKNGSAYYCKDAQQANHAVSIVGWDDGYSAENFKETPPGDGAFIIRNSWGTGWYEKGYMYVSYYDRTLGFGDVQVAYASLSKGNDYGRVYQHDPYGYVNSIGYGSETIYGANVFAARTNETLAAFGFYALEANMAYSAYIVLDPVFSDGELYGDWVSVKEGVCLSAGYEVIPFDRDIALDRCGSFAIIVKITVTGVACQLPVCRNENFNDGTPYLTNMASVAGLSLSCLDPQRYYWNDESANGSYFCCKVYAKAQEGSFSTTSTDAPVPYSWLEIYAGQHGSDYFQNYYCGCYNALAEHIASNGVSIETSFAKGLDPDNAVETNLCATISFDASNKAVIGVTPQNTALYDYTFLGSQDLSDWHRQTAADRFFKVLVQSK